MTNTSLPKYESRSFYTPDLTIGQIHERIAKARVPYYCAWNEKVQVGDHFVLYNGTEMVLVRFISRSDYLAWERKLFPEFPALHPSFDTFFELRPSMRRESLQ